MLVVINNRDMNLFEKRFSIILEQPELPAQAELPDIDELSAPGEGDPTSNVDTINAIGRDVPENPGIQYKKQENDEMTAEIRKWIQKLDTFNEELNGLNSGSFQAKLNSATCDTIFDKIASSEGKKISRIARDLSGLSETLKGFLLSSKEN